jgi:hypothetical protein
MSTATWHASGPVRTPCTWSLAPTVVGHKDRTLNVSGSFAVREMKLGAGPSMTWRAVTGEGAEEVPPPDSPRWNEEDRRPNLRGWRRTLCLRQALPRQSNGFVMEAHPGVALGQQGVEL